MTNDHSNNGTLPRFSFTASTSTNALHYPNTVNTTITGLMTSPASSLMNVAHVNRLHLPPIVTPAKSSSSFYTTSSSLSSSSPPPSPSSSSPASSSVTDGFMLFCADQTSPTLPVKATPILYERWNALSKETKKIYHRQAIIVNTKADEASTADQQCQTYPHDALLPQLPPKHLVSPEAIQSVEREEKEEALGDQPFSAYSSFLSMKHSYEQKHSKTDSSPPSSSLTAPPPPPNDHSPSLTRSPTPSPSPTSSTSLNYLVLPTTCSSSASSSPSSTPVAAISAASMHQKHVYQASYGSVYQQYHRHQMPLSVQQDISEDQSQVSTLATCVASKNTQISIASQLGADEADALASLDNMVVKSSSTNPAAVSATMATTATQKKRSDSRSSVITVTRQERLKRPPNAYLLFNRDMRRKLLALDPKMTVSEISKEIGDRWKYLPPNERQHYVTAAQILKQNHLKTHPDFIYTRRSKAELAEAKRLSKSGRRASTTPTTSTTCSSSPSSSLMSATRQQHKHSVATSTAALSAPAALSSPTYSQGRFSLDTVNETSFANINNSSSSSFLLLTSGHGKDPTTVSPNNNTSFPSKEPTGATSSGDPRQRPASKRRGRQRSEDKYRDPRGRKKKRHKHPTAPKHPMSGFLFFLGAIRPEVAQQFPGSTVGPISKEISSRWKNMSSKDREPWLLKAELDKARYAEEMQVYMSNLKQQEQQQTVSPVHKNGDHGNNSIGAQRSIIDGAGNILPDHHETHSRDDDGDDDLDGDGNDQMIATVVQMVNGPNTMNRSPPPSADYSSFSHLYSTPSSTLPIVTNGSSPASNVYSYSIPSSHSNVSL